MPFRYGDQESYNFLRNHHNPDMTSRTMYLSKRGVEKVLAMTSLDTTPSVVLFMSKDVDYRRLFLEYSPEIAVFLDAIQFVYGVKDSGYYSELDRRESKQQSDTIDIAADYPYIFTERIMTKERQARAIQLTGIQTGAFLLHSLITIPYDLFDAFKGFCMDLNLGNVVMPGSGTVFVNFRFFPRVPNSSRMQIAVDDFGHHREILDTIQTALPNCPFTIKYKWDALRHAGIRNHSHDNDPNLKRTLGKTMACDGYLTDPLEFLAAQIDEVLDMVKTLPIFDNSQFFSFSPSIFPLTYHRTHRVTKVEN